MTDRPAVAFIRLGDRPLANESFRLALEQALPEVDLVTIDLKPLLKRDRGRLARLALAAGGRYGFRLARRWHKPEVALLRTPTAARGLRALALEALGSRRWAATVQIQSLFDAHQPGVPHFVYTDHTHMANLSYEHFDWKRMYDREWTTVERDLFSAAEAVLVRSTNVASSVMHHYGVAPAKVHVIGAGPNAPIKSLSGSRDPFEILFVGIDFERKGGPELLRAFAKVHEVEPRARLTIAGATVSSQPGVVSLGRISRDEVAECFGRAGIFCLPTRVEPFGVVVVEALHAGLPIVASSVGAIPDMVANGENGYLVPPGDEGALAEALLKLMGDPDLQAGMGARSRQRAETVYSWDAVGTAVRQLLLPAISAS